jgi:hypothetical protein
MMQRTQVTLDPVDHRRARRRAAELGVSLAEYIRQLVRRDLGEAVGRSDATSLFALGDSGGSDIAANKDRYVGEALVRDRADR